MKRPLQICLAITLALAMSEGFALGLGPVRVESGLDQPLKAEIPIIEGSANEADGLAVQLATAADFKRVGLDRTQITMPLEFTIGKDAGGKPVIRVTSDAPVREPFLDFLIEANWPKGRMLREYTVLLDPPVMAPATSHASAMAPAAPPPTSHRAEQRPVTAGQPAATAGRAASSAGAARSASSSSGDTYGPVAAGETLSAIARSTRPDANTNRLMLAMLQANPNAFFDGNINNLKRGAILRIPSASQIAAVGSTAEAAARVREQVQQWHGAAARPTLVAKAGTNAATKPRTANQASSSKPGNSARLELVPPKGDQDNTASEQPGSGSGSHGSAAADARLKADLARARESLATSNQESSDLKARVKELETIKDKNNHLLSLKDSQIADLQQQLQRLHEKNVEAGKEAAAKPPSTPAHPAVKNDIFGEPVTNESSTARAPSTTAPAATVGATTAGNAPAPGAESGQPKPTTPTPEAMAPGAENGVAGVSPAPAQPSTSTPETSANPPGPTMPAASGPAKSSVSTAVAAKPEATTVVRPIPPNEPAWYTTTWLKIAALIAALLVLIGLLAMRRKSTPVVSAGRGSIASAFGDSPLADADDDAVAAAAPEEIDDESDAEERILREQIRHDPADLGLRLELLSIYYARRDVAQYEAAAQEMAAYVDDPEEPEWQQVKAMGEELAPENDLFSSAGMPARRDYEASPRAHEADESSAFASDHDVMGQTGITDGFDSEESMDEPVERDAEAAAVSWTHFDLDTFDAKEPPKTPPVDSDSAEVHPAHDLVTDTDDDALAPASSVPLKAGATSAQTPLVQGDSPATSFNLPPLEFEQGRVDEPPATPASATAVPPAQPAPAKDTAAVAVPGEEFLAGEDAVGTKLDLARAYLDMGDPEGARSMLDEVLSEGNAAQQDDARKLMAEIS